MTTFRPWHSFISNIAGCAVGAADRRIISPDEVLLPSNPTVTVPPVPPGAQKVPKWMDCVAVTVKLRWGNTGCAIEKQAYNKKLIVANNDFKTCKFALDGNIVYRFYQYAIS